MSSKEKELANVCFNCKGQLRSSADGHYHSTKSPVRSICCTCGGCDGTVKGVAAKRGGR